MKKEYTRIAQLLLIICAVILGACFLPKNTVSAAPATPVQVASVEYYEDQIIVLNNGNSKIYYAEELDAAKDDWEVVNADAGLYTMIDISWLSPSTENILVVKGEENPTPYRIIISEKPLKLDISINYAELDNLADTSTIAPLVNIMTSAGTGANPITFNDLEWRKGTTGQWRSTNSAANPANSLTAGLLKKYLVRGTTLYFRIRAVDDVVKTTYSGTVRDFNQERIDGVTGGISKYNNPALISFDASTFPDGTEGRRFSNEIPVKIAKKAASLVYGIDGEDFTAEIKYGKEYRVTTTVSGTTVTTPWIQVTDRTIRYIPLSVVLNDPALDGLTAGTAFPEMMIEIRDYATSKAASSKITEIDLNAQRIINQTQVKKGPAPVPGVVGDNNIYISYNGNKYMIVEIPSASLTLPYEYYLLKPGETFDNDRAVWNTISKGTAVKILSSKALDGGTIYIRQKEIEYRAATDTADAVSYELASTCVTQAIKYPSIPEITDQKFTYIKGFPIEVSFTAALNAVGRDPFETAVKNIKLGTRTIDFTTEASAAGGINYLKITLKDASLAGLTNCSNRLLTINYANGTVDKNSITLTIQSPTPAGSLTLTMAKGTTAGTAFTLVSSLGLNDTWVYIVSAAEIKEVYMQDTIATVTGTVPTALPAAANSADNITVTAGQYLTVFELNSSGYIVKYKSIQITADMIK